MVNALVKDKILSSGRSNERHAAAKSPISSLKKQDSLRATAVTSELTSLLADSSPATDCIPSNGVIDRQFDDISDAVSHYQGELHQKDELIAALIRELEQAVEQLDRFQRTGARYGQGTPTPQGGSSDAFVDSSPPWMDDLRRMAADWERSQPTTLLERIESQLADVYGMMRDLKDPPSQSTPDSYDFEERLRRLSQASEPEPQSEPAQPTFEQSSPTLDAIRRQYLENEAVAQPAEPARVDPELLKLVTETPTPHEINFAAATFDELKQAVIERDAYIVQLNRLFRTHTAPSLPADWATLANVPSEMQLRVETLIEHLDVQVRLGEVEMSLERARLSRERSQMQSEREQVEKHMRRLGLTSLAELDHISSTTGSATDRRWMRFLGPNTK